ncbi:MAG TPA: cation diffusion facilitator family transporter [Nevskiaceae bacterium]|nr:cation diffusion facilitator family transporter [Nevskiaceae bacterium]
MSRVWPRSRATAVDPASAVGRLPRPPHLPWTTRYALLSLIAAVLVLGLKLTAWRVTGSVGLLSDALETLTNVGGALMALAMLHVAAMPPDRGHAFGHSKAEYFSGGFEGMLVFFAAALIIVSAVPRLMHPQPLQGIGVGLLVAIAAGWINFIVATVLSRAGRWHDSVALRADARHLMADVWTTVGVVVGVGLTAVTGWHWLDPLVALGVALQVLWTGYRLMSESASGLMDGAWPPEELAALMRVLDECRAAHGEGEVDFHAVRTRRSAGRRFVTLHVLVPGDWSVRNGHDLAEWLEQRVRQAVPRAIAFTHVEPLEDPRSYDEQAQDRRL